MPRKLSLDLFSVWQKVRMATRQSQQILKEVDADVVVGFGGYAALPAYLAARKVACGLVIHEANAKPGLANKLAARFADEVFVSVPGSLRGTTMALPLRSSIAKLDRQQSRSAGREFFGLSSDAPVLLVFGGSQGAQRINEVISQSLPGLLELGIQVLHGYGPKNVSPTSRAGYVAVSYFDRMDLAYAAADLGLTRAGAMTVAEVSAVGLPTIFVPLPIGNGEQKLNALNMANAGGAVVIDNASLNAEWLTQAVGSLVKDGVKLNEMSQAAARCGVKDAGLQLAERVLGVAYRHRAMKSKNERDNS
ncbi:unannotated protein [freshwater metagenome]|uniref:Unannotated protein n=2 Tax=freshwater metagenome TaxID=449393 RepID=A0A6J7S4B1_9ZZZZ